MESNNIKNFNEKFLNEDIEKNILNKEKIEKNMLNENNYVLDKEVKDYILNKKIKERILTNEEKQLLKKFLLNNKKNLSQYDKQFFLHQLNGLCNSNLDDVSPESLISDVKKINDCLECADETILTRRRFLKLVDVIEKLSEYLKNPDEKLLVEISYEIDCLFFDMDFDLRKTNTLVRKVKGNK